MVLGVGRCGSACQGKVKGRGARRLVDVFAGAVGGASYVKGSASAAVSAAARCETPSPGGERRRQTQGTRVTLDLWHCWSAARPERRRPPPPGGGGWPAPRRCGRGRRCRYAAGHPSGSPDPGRCACCPGKSEHTSDSQKDPADRGRREALGGSAGGA